jgi:hypothetical protein
LKAKSTIKEAKELASIIDKSLLSIDERFKGAVKIICEDEGSVMFFDYAFAEKYEDWWFIFTEHHNFFVYPVEDIRISRYKRIG